MRQAKEAAVGVEPTNNGFANRRLGPLGYAALILVSLYSAGQFCKEIKAKRFFVSCLEIAPIVLELARITLEWFSK